MENSNNLEMTQNAFEKASTSENQETELRVKRSIHLPNEIWLKIMNYLKTPFHIALILEYKEFVLFLLQMVLFFNAKDLDKITPIEEGLMRKQMTDFKTRIV